MVTYVVCTILLSILCIYKEYVKITSWDWAQQVLYIGKLIFSVLVILRKWKYSFRSFCFAVNPLGLINVSRSGCKLATCSCKLCWGFGSQFCTVIICITIKCSYSQCKLYTYYNKHSCDKLSFIPLSRSRFHILCIVSLYKGYFVLLEAAHAHEIMDDKFACTFKSACWGLLCWTFGFQGIV